MAFREKSAWISLLVTLVVYGVYFALFARATMEGRAFGLAVPLIVAVIAIVVLQIVLIVPVAAVAPRDANAPQDERERDIHKGADAGAFYVLQVGVMCAIVTVYFTPPLVMANIALAALAIAQAAKYGLTILGYRRGL